MRITLLFKITCKSLIYKAYKDILRKEISRAKLSKYISQIGGCLIMFFRKIFLN